MEIQSIQHTYMVTNDSIKTTKHSTGIDPATNKPIYLVESWTTQVYNRRAEIEQLHTSQFDQRA